MSEKEENEKNVTKDSTVADVMDRDVYVCHADATVGELTDRLIELKVSSLPVVEPDDETNIIGFVSDGDIMRAIASYGPQSIFNGAQSSMVYFDDETTGEKVRRLASQNVMDIATRNVVCVQSNRAIGDVARVLSKKRFKKMPVIDESGSLVGIVRRKSIIKYAFARGLRGTEK
ncbi:MAG: CBS domain-containing protein [Bifidobacteriaceae bacterium]|nr:CBS domain-containing protein [Bifidobacteriaceae bacterium]